MKKSCKIIGLVLTMLTLVLALAGSYVPVASTAPERVIKVGLQVAWTGPLATATVPVYQGVIDRIRYINETQGGINGIKVEALHYDSKGMVPGGIINHKRYKDAGVVVEFQEFSHQVSALVDDYQRDEIPCSMVVSGIPDFMTEPRWVFLSYPTTLSEYAVFLTYVKETWTEKRPPRIAIMSFETPDGFFLIEGAPKVSADYGCEFVGYEVLPYVGTVDTSTEWLRMVERKADWVYAYGVGVSLNVAVKDSARLEIQQKGIKLCGWMSICDEPMLKVVGKSANGWHMMFPCFSPSVEAEKDLPAVKKVAEIAKKYRGWEEKDATCLYSIGNAWAMVVLEGIRIALEKVGYENLTGRAVRDGLASIGDFETGLVPPVTMSDERPWFCKGAQVYHIEEVKRVPVHDYIEFPNIGLFG